MRGALVLRLLSVCQLCCVTLKGIVRLCWHLMQHGSLHSEDVRPALLVKGVLHANVDQQRTVVERLHSEGAAMKVAKHQIMRPSSPGCQGSCRLQELPAATSPAPQRS